MQSVWQAAPHRGKSRSRAPTMRTLRFRIGKASGIRGPRGVERMESRRSGAEQLRWMCACVAVLIAALVPTVAPAQAKAASPVLEFASATAFPILFTADGGEVTAALTGFDTVVHCTGS